MTSEIHEYEKGHKVKLRGESDSFVSAENWLQWAIQAA